MSCRYLFLDMNSFFASVEQQSRPELRNRPLAVVPLLADTTCCIAASYEAKAYGIRTGTSVFEALRRCPDLRLVEARPPLYIEVHRRLVDAVETCLPVRAVCSIDELVCRLVGEEQHPEQALRLAQRVKTVLREQLGPWLRCSIGLAPNQWLAKIAADRHKPDGLTQIGVEDLPAALYELELSDLPGIGPRMERRLRQQGITSVEQLCGLSAAELSALWGSRLLGQMWWRQLRGEDVVLPPRQRHSVGHSRVLPPEWRHETKAWAVLVRLVEKLAARLRHIGCWAGRVDLCVDYLHGRSWRGFRRLTLCQDTLTLLRVVRQLWNIKPRGTPFRLGVVLGNLRDQGQVADSLFEDDRKYVALSHVMDEIQQKLGVHAIYFAASGAAREEACTRIAFTQIPDLRLVDP